MEPESAPAAPAQPAATSAPASLPSAPDAASPATRTAADQAVVAQDVAAYRAARRAERDATSDRRPDRAARPGGPAVPADPGAVQAAEARTVSKRQQTINDYERRVAELQAENARLKSSAPRAESPAAPAPTRAGDPLAIDLTQPLLDEGAFYTKFPTASSADYHRYITRYDREMERATEQLRTAQRDADTAAQTRAQKFAAQFMAAGDPAALRDRLDPALLALETRAAAQAQHKRITAANDLAEEILDSEVALQVLEHLTAHPEVTATLLAAPTRRALVRAFSRLEAQMTPSAAAGPTVKTTTDAPPPAVTLGARSAQMGDPLDRAVVAGDVAAYRAARRAQRAADLR
jgi:hypothetical protein